MMKIGLFFTLLLISNLAKAKASYTLADLEVLTQEGSYEEFFQHALDIRPSERQDAWKGMVSKMADGFSRQILGRSDITKEEFKKVEELFNWPSLRSDDVFKIHRQQIGLRYLKNCLKLETPCWAELRAFWESDQKDPETAFKLAELTISYAQKPIPTWTFLDVALKSPLSEFYCKRDFVLDALWGKFEVDYIRIGTSGNLLKKIDETVHPDCLFSLNRWLQDKLMRPEKSSDRELAYQLLAAQDKITPALSDFFYTVYLLENPSKGELFNYAWNRLSELSRSIDRREEVLRRLKSLDPLPDELFASMDENKRKVVLNHFKNKFPEYLYYYSDQCLTYYGGKSSFPNGNPTMKCQNLMDSPEASTWIGEDKIQRYRQLKSL